MPEYQLGCQDRVDSALKHLEDYLFEKQSWSNSNQSTSTNKLDIQILEEQLRCIQRKIHNRNETLNHYLDGYKHLSIEQAAFLLNGFNPNSLDSHCFKGFHLGNDTLLSSYLINKTPAGRILNKEFKAHLKIPIERLVRLASSRGFIFNSKNRTLDKDITIKLHSLLIDKELIENSDIQKLWTWRSTDTLLAYLARELIGIGVLPYHQPWKVLEAYIPQNRKKRLSKISRDIKPNGYQTIDSVIKALQTE